MVVFFLLTLLVLSSPSYSEIMDMGARKLMMKGYKGREMGEEGITVDLLQARRNPKAPPAPQANNNPPGPGTASKRVP